MRVEEVRIGVPLEQVLDDEEGVVAVLHPRPEIRFPTETPARGPVTALDQCGARGLEEVGRARRGDLVGRIQSIEVRDVAVLVVRVVAVLDPFLQLAVLPHLHRRQFGERLLQLRAVIGLIQP